MVILKISAIVILIIVILWFLLFCLITGLKEEEEYYKAGMVANLGPYKDIEGSKHDFSILVEHLESMNNIKKGE